MPVPPEFLGVFATSPVLPKELRGVLDAVLSCPRKP